VLQGGTSARNIGVVALLTVTLLAISTATASAGADAASRALAVKVTAFQADPSQVVIGQSTHVRVVVRNDASTASGKRDWLIRLRDPAVIGPARNLVRHQLGRIPAGKTKEFEADIVIPANASTGEHPLFACRAQLDEPNKCGRVKRETTLTVLSPARLAISPGTRDFGTHPTATSSATQTFTVTNAGEAPSGIISTAIAGADADQFAKSADTCNGQVLAPGASCTLSASFAPTSTGAKSPPRPSR